MERSELVPAKEFCTYHHISHSFIRSLEDAGLIEIISIEEESFLHLENIQDLEKLVRLHTELEINPEGIEAIAHLLQRMQMMQQQMKELQQRLSLYEHEEE
jgi:chaperone modulatory protein CbpM